MSLDNHAALNDQSHRSQHRQQQSVKQNPALPDPLIVRWGRLQGTRYDFNKAGDVLPRHRHEVDNAHVVIVQLGSCVVREFEGREVIEYVLEAGQTLDSAAPVEHEIEALEDNTRILNLIK